MAQKAAAICLLRFPSHCCCPGKESWLFSGGSQCHAKAAGLPGDHSPADAGSIHRLGEETAQLLPRNSLREPRGGESWCGRESSLQRKDRAASVVKHGARHRVVSSHKQDMQWSGAEEKRVHGAGWGEVYKCRGQCFLRLLLMQADLLEGSKSSSRQLKTMFQKSVSNSCKCCVMLWVNSSPGL